MGFPDDGRAPVSGGPEAPEEGVEEVCAGGKATLHTEGVNPDGVRVAISRSTATADVAHVVWPRRAVGIDRGEPRNQPTPCRRLPRSARTPIMKAADLAPTRVRDSLAPTADGEPPTRVAPMIEETTADLAATRGSDSCAHDGQRATHPRCANDRRNPRGPGGDAQER
ncbi:hypothetical protein GCM10009687_55200 [Asanoa iriomotensis]